MTSRPAGSIWRRAEVWIPAAYALLASTWVAVSDDLLHLVVTSAREYGRWSTIKGWAFIFGTAVVFHLWLKRVLARRDEALRRAGESEGQSRRLVEEVRQVNAALSAEREGLRESREQLRTLAGRLQTAREDEQARMARDLHDELGQLLTGLQMDLRWLEKRIGELPSSEPINALLDRVVAASGLADQTVVSVQRIAAELRPGALDRLGLAPALRQEGRRFEERTGVVCETLVDEAAPEPPPEVATALYRICQEAMTNVSRHAGASRVVVRLLAEPGALLLRVEDDGRGIDDTALGPEAIGLLGMTERATMLGGQLRIERGAAGGTLVEARVPLAPHLGTGTGGRT